VNAPAAHFLLVRPLRRRTLSSCERSGGARQSGHSGGRSGSTRAAESHQSATPWVRHQSARTSIGPVGAAPECAHQQRPWWFIHLGGRTTNLYSVRANAPAAHFLLVRTLRRRTPKRPLRWPLGLDSRGGVASECDSLGAAPECAHQQMKRGPRQRACVPLFSFTPPPWLRPRARPSRRESWRRVCGPEPARGARHGRTASGTSRLSREPRFRHQCRETGRG
jgi:hypothetical protein